MYETSLRGVETLLDLYGLVNLRVTHWAYCCRVFDFLHESEGALLGLSFAVPFKFSRGGCCGCCPTGIDMSE